MIADERIFSKPIRGLNRLRKHRAKVVEQPTNRWVSLPTSQAAGSGVSLKLGKVVLEVEPGFDEQTFTSVLRALMAAC